MIKVGIHGAETIAAGELIRILINHPDVVLTTVASEEAASLPVTQLHRGLEGDIDMTVEASLNPEGLDVVFLCGEPWRVRQWVARYHEYCASSNIRLIDLTGTFHADSDFPMVYGLCEYNRKALVRGATRATIPTAAAMAVELALFPLAKNQMIDGPVEATVGIADSERYSGSETVEGQGGSPQARRNIVESTRLDPVAPLEHRLDSNAEGREIGKLVAAIQSRFAPTDVKVNISKIGWLSRGLTATVDVPCSASLAEVRRLFDDAYSDHSFTYVIDRVPAVADVANTNKCLLHVDYPAERGVMASAPRLRVSVAIDNILKGGAGNAVHVMNLLFGLSERTGLTLKASSI